MFYFILAVCFQNYLQLHGGTIHLAITLLDQYLARRKVSLAKLQLIGITSLLVAAKFHDRFPPTVRTTLYTSGNNIHGSGGSKGRGSRG